MSVPTSEVMVDIQEAFSARMIYSALRIILELCSSEACSISFNSCHHLSNSRKFFTVCVYLALANKSATDLKFAWDRQEGETQKTRK